MRSPVRRRPCGVAIEVAAAQAELVAAEALFNLAREPLLVDHAIHRVLAAERRLAFLLHVARGIEHA